MTIKKAIFFFIISTHFSSFHGAAGNCGQAQAGLGNIVGGYFVPRGFSPWSAVLIISDGSYLCGGTIVSSSKVITAAHCINIKFSSVTLRPRDIRVLLGPYNLTDPYEGGRTIASVTDIKVNPSWNPNVEQYDADIAIVTLEIEISFNKFIQPVCLDFNDDDIKSNPKGITIGYGKSEDVTKAHENLPKIITTPIIGTAECVTKSPSLARIASTRTICGGKGDGTGVCDGDSGSGLFVIKNKTHYLRGIVSSSLFYLKETNNSDQLSFTCNVDDYAVFTDVLSFKDWIESELLDQAVPISFGTESVKPKSDSCLGALEQQGVWVGWNKYKEGVPKYAVRNNYEDGDKYYVVRAHHDGQLIPGKYAIVERKAYIGSDNKELLKENFELLTHTNFIWSDDHNDGLQWILGGHDENGTKIYICRTRYQNTWIGGKIVNKKCQIPFGGMEQSADWFQVLKVKTCCK